MTSPAAISIQALEHHYGDFAALRGVSFEVNSGEIFGLLGPNGGGKTTLFRVLCTLLPLQQGAANVCGFDVSTQPASVRSVIGVTFQSPSLDGKLTVAENLKHQGHLYGIGGSDLRSRIDRALKRLQLTDRAKALVDSLSGGLKRRVEIAKGLLHDPQVLLLDEPSTGLDPGARHDLWQFLDELRRESGMTILVTTHLMEEAERCDRLGILNLGELVAQGTPEELRASVGGDCLTIQSATREDLAPRIREKFDVEVKELSDSLRIEVPNGHDLLREIVTEYPTDVEAITLGKPTLEDVFIARTGHRFWEEEQR
ncbi:ABC transporter ATP-binding protein [Calycomorphotria hydatis]|uniref:Putative ABC transporter ATP-binding protein YbhF n=1 Tax=Calycomorphotria hydatis TaxID=2528027 RepID=A0A517TCP6_9PLAN|nr:ATP-binding cassette domain-containing protein [Calycomorphotria hydatis]QDT66145.1 putative ABC transporter ATP-binding protein YbhF [Calycomorphotria hydatis]